MLEFFRWQPDNKHFYFKGISLALYITCVVASFLAVILIWIFKNPIHRWYNSKSIHLGTLSSKSLKILIGSITIVFMIIRSLMLWFAKYPNIYEIIPFHLCRLMLLFTALSLVFNKVNLIKYFGPIAIIGCIIALLYPSFDFVPATKPQKIGIDSAYFYDYILCHCFLLIITSMLLATHRIQIKAKDLLITTIFFICLALIMFGINLVTYIYAPKGWQTNYLYLGKDEVNSQSNLFGVLSKWPWNLFTWTILGLIFYSIFVAIWIVQDKVQIDFMNRKMSISVKKSDRWVEFKNSQKVNSVQSK